MLPEQPKRPTFQRFDYRIRPNKNTERRMFSEAFRRLSFFELVENYRYIGFGSTTFTDFILFHRILNLKDMISIEKQIDYENRFEFNKPYHCVEMKYGDTSEVLPELSWDKRTIIWLDYDGSLNGSVLRDIALVSLKAISGSVLIVTVNAEGMKKGSEDQKLNQFKQILEREELPPAIRGKNLEADEMAKTCRTLISGEIQEALRARNGLTPDENKMKYQSLFNFVYRDGSKMLTVGGIFYEAGDQAILDRCQFDSLEYITLDSDEPYEIKVPVLTPRERQYLNQRLPYGAHEEASALGLTVDEIADYIRLYRYCPSFAEVESF